ncbi:HPr kinase/phosphatase C-terminal domain-containing protein [Roseobacter sp. HKCCA0434]|uniref:HPr kinase/phosphorylase n=1 Tax=Roseobacter sp. HKCCA0434 TaxID=3079297 RepID=UPI002905A101|nr:HPr kinase/phosphatase C-terminal domain-containing protein [Roseobacter sp. HKCCA0434]
MSLHATAVAGRKRGLIIVGAAGSGKSSLALDLVSRGCRLIADDRVILEAEAGRLVASPPSTLRGRIELRGIGIGRVGAVTTGIHLCVDLDEIPDGRQPPQSDWTACGITLRRLPARGVVGLAATLHLWLDGSLDFEEQT